MHLLYRILCRIFFLRPKAVPFFKVDPELEEKVIELAAARSELLGWSLYGNPQQKDLAKKKEDQYIAEMQKHGEKLKQYLMPYIEADKKQPPYTYGKGEHDRWYLARSLEDFPTVKRIIPDHMLE